jgi:hypothetical protein
MLEEMLLTVLRLELEAVVEQMLLVQLEIVQDQEEQEEQVLLIVFQVVQ